MQDQTTLLTIQVTNRENEILKYIRDVGEHDIAAALYYAFEMCVLDPPNDCPLTDVSRTALYNVYYLADSCWPRPSLHKSIE